MPENHNPRQPSASEAEQSTPTGLQRKQLEERLRAIRQGSLEALSRLLKLKDAGRGLHTSRLSPWAVEVATRLGAAGRELEEIEIAYELHDVGRIGVPDALLLRPDRLTEEEMRQVRRHPEYGWTILHPIPGLETISLLILHQNEWFDGSGSPGKLAGENIPLGSRILAAVDTFEALVSERPFRRGVTPQQAIGHLEAAAGKRLDPQVVRELIAVVEARLSELPEILGDRPA